MAEKGVKEQVLAMERLHPKSDSPNDNCFFGKIIIFLLSIIIIAAL